MYSLLCISLKGITISIAWCTSALTSDVQSYRESDRQALEVEIPIKVVISYGSTSRQEGSCN